MQSLSLDQNPTPLYLLSGDEPLLLRDWLDDARDSLKQAGIEDIQSHSTDTSFDWDDLLYESGTPSLFADKKCRIIRITNGKPGQQGSKVIQALCDEPQDDTIFIFVLPKLDRSSRNSSWFKRLLKVGKIVELKPVYNNQLVDWIARTGEVTLDTLRRARDFLGFFGL